MRNRYDVAGAARRNGRLGRQITLRPIIPPATIEAAARRFGIAVIRGWTDAVRDLVLPAYGAALDFLIRDDATDTLASALGAAREGMSRLVLTLTPQMNDWTVRVETWHRRRYGDVVKSALGVDVFPFLSIEDVRDEIGAALERHASLIRGLSDDQRRRVEETTWREFLRQTPRREIAKALQRDLDIGRARANLIARDQTAKLAGELDGLRQQQAGIEEYVWRHSGKANPRPTHVARDRKIFRWDKPPADGHPGYAINCGCKAQAHIDLGDDE